MVSDVTVSTALEQQSSTASATTGLAEDFTEFLQLLTIQLQNQDPLSPMDTTEFTNQLVAFSGVEQQINANQKLDSLVALQLGNSIGSAIGYVGQEVSYVSSEFNFDGENTNSILYALNSEAVESTLRIFDEDGTEVFSTEASENTGQNEFVWDGTLSGGGTADPGTYSIRIDALDNDGNGIGSTTVVQGLVTGVESQNGSIYAIVGERAVSLGNVLSVNIPSSTLIETTDDTATTDETDDGGSVDTDSDEATT